MTTILTAEQLETVRASCTATTYGVPQTLDSGTFQALATSGLNLSKATPLICAPGQVICWEGEPGDEMYLIRSGHAAITKGSFDAPIVLACRGSGEFVGEMALLENLPRSASVVALDEVYLYQVTREDFQRMLSHSTKLDVGMLRKLSSRLREADDLITTTTHARRSLSSQVNELEAENQQLMELQRLREQTTDLVVHDLRNPLHSIMGAVGMLQMILPPAMLQENRDLFNLVNSNCDRMQRLVDSLLDISRMESGETELNLEPANLAQLIQAAVSRLSSTLQSRGIASSVFMPAHLPPVEIDVDMIDRVVVNLLDNAIKFTPSGGQIGVTAETHADHVAVSINDNGCGIPPEQRPHIFERFARGSSEGLRPRGFGLGLTFCRLAVEAHGGKIWVEDGEGGVGCKSIFTLPLEHVA
ncbi:two-component system, OmpR family, phosphate regulon sensor histidine kinase PhoR [Thermoflexales bacterium]|nr:two-component system, OmpR family, phosphate regulon sensor histidine kinase PhoR [Thermoflexales bacterium]